MEYTNELTTNDAFNQFIVDAIQKANELSLAFFTAKQLKIIFTISNCGVKKNT